MTLPFRPATPPGQTQLHPTVPYGQPGGPQATVIPPGQPMPTWEQQAAANGQPNGQPQAQPLAPPAPEFYNREGQRVDSQGRPFGQPAPQFQPQGTFPATGPLFQPAPQPQNQQSQNQNLPDDFVFDGDNVPQELRGRTWRQVRGVYGALASEFIARPGAAPAPAPNMPGQAAPAPQAVAQATQQPDRVTSFWQDPLGAIERVVDSRLAPIQQNTAIQRAEQARNTAANQIPDWNALEAEVIEIAKALPQEQIGEAIQSAGWWANAADLARGRLMNRGQYTGQQRAPANPQQADPRYAPRSVPAAHEFFTEAPTAPQGNNFYTGGQPNQYELTPEQQMYATKMGMSFQEYKDWSGGVQRPSTARRW